MKANCPNCGVSLSETPEEDGLHPVQMATPVESGETYCETCAYGGSGAEASEGEYENTGDRIVRASRVELDDDELAQLLAQTLYAEELRSWMSAHDLSRPRGARKLESAEEAVRQNRTLVAAAMERTHDDVGASQEHVAMCSCGYEEHFGEEDLAVDAAEGHQDDNPEHSPKAWAEDGRRLWG